MFNLSIILDRSVWWSLVNRNGALEFLGLPIVPIGMTTTVLNHFIFTQSAKYFL